MALGCCLAAIPLAASDPPATSDGLYHLLRAAELNRQLLAGVIYPRWAPDFYLGYGYPIFMFTPLLPYYLVVAVHAVGLALAPAMAVTEAAALLAAGLLGYAWLRRHVAAPAAAAGATLYALAPYHLTNLYYRGDLAEFLAAAWFPLILLTLDRLLERPAPRSALSLGLAVATLLLTHYLSAMLFIPAAGLVAVASLAWRKPRRLAGQLAAGAGGAALGAGLSAFAWLPAVAMTPDATFAKLLRFYGVAQNFATARQLFSLAPLQGYTPVFAGSGGFGYQFGLLQSLALIFGAVALSVGWRATRRETRGVAVALALVALLSLLGALRLAAPVWTALPALQLTQFPWRLLAIAALPAAFFAALALQRLAQRQRAGAAGAAMLLIAVSSLALLRPPRLALPADFTTAAGIARFELLYHLAGTSAAAEYLPPWASERQTVSALAFARAVGVRPPADPAASMATWTPSARQEAFPIHLEQAGTVTLPVLDFPGWVVSIDGKAAASRPTAGSGLIAVAVPSGAHTVVATWRDPTVVKMGNAVTAVAAGVMLLSAIVAARRGRGIQPPANNTKPPTGADKAIVVAKSERPWQSRRGFFVSAGGFIPRPRWGFAHSLAGGRSFPTRRQSITGALIAIPGAIALVLAGSGSRAAANGVQLLDITLAGDVHVSGYSLAIGTTPPDGAVQALPGATVRLAVNATAPAGERLAAQLTDAATTDWGDWQATPQDGAAVFSLVLPDALPPGLYQLRLGAVAPSGAVTFTPTRLAMTRLLPVDGTALVGPLVVTAPPAPPPAAAPPVGVWPGHAALLQPRVPTRAAAGAALALAWLWQAPATGNVGRLTESLHLLDAAGHQVAAADAEPAAGYYPSSFWTPGALALDRPTLPIPADTPPGNYRLLVGLGQGATAFPAQDAAGKALGDDIVAGQVTVLPPATPAPWAGPGQSAGPLQVELATPPGQAVPGRPLSVALRWHSAQAPGANATATLTLAAHGKLLAQSSAPVGGTAYPLARWRASETERQFFDLPVGGTAPAGPAQLDLSLRAADGTVSTVPLAVVTVVGRPRVYQAAPASPQAITFANGIQLIGDDLRVDGKLVTSGAVIARQSLAVTLYWRAAGPTPAPLKVTVQLLSAANRLLAQADTEPGGGAAPTTSWAAGEIVTSDHTLDLASVPPGAARLIVALYDPATGRRVLAGRSDTATLAAVTVP